MVLTFGLSRQLARSVALIGLALVLGVTTAATPSTARRAGVEPAAVLDDTTLVTITTSADSVDGNTASFASLNASPGPDGLVSLREALLAANATASGADLTIAFALPVDDPGYRDGVWELVVQPANGPLPQLARGHVMIDGSTQPGAVQPAIVLEGSNNATISDGFTITSASNVLRGLAIQHFYNQGILLLDGARDTRISGCVLRGNQDNGILLLGNVTDTRIVGSLVQANRTAGIELRDGPTNTVIGGVTATDRNIISGNGYSGVLLNGPGTRNNTLAGNWIGLDADGRTAQANAVAGVRLTNASQNTIGGSIAAGNIISGNDSGISIEQSDNNLVAGNIIGLAADGLTPLGNTDGGIFLRGGASGNLIGGTLETARNIIASNGSATTLYGQGIYITEAGTTNNLVQGNLIGLSVDADGRSVARGNTSYGIQISYDATNNLVGGTLRELGNVIAANGFGGVRLDSPNNQVASNMIGTGLDGQTPLGNQNNGVRVRGDNTVVGPNNVIVFSALSGVILLGQNAQVVDNFLAFNQRSGICIAGLNALVAGNVVSNNGGAAGPWAECNLRGGIVIDDGNSALVRDNTISDNTGAGIAVQKGTSNRLLSNSITDNTVAGIVLEQGGNHEIAPPTLFAVTQAQVEGQSCPNCLVEVYNDSADEGQYMLGSAQATGDGVFQLALNPTALRRPNITATQTDAAGNTSPFAAPVDAPIVDEPGPTPEPIPNADYQVLLPLMVQTE